MFMSFRTRLLTAWVATQWIYVSTVQVRAAAARGVFDTCR